MKSINTETEGTKLFRVLLGTGFFWMAEFNVYADNEQDAIDTVADYVQWKEPNLCADHYEIMDLCDSNQTVAEYAEANGLTCAGNCGVYIQIAGIEELK